jgi:5'(3')-deoxyribonucleotidase
LEVIKEMKILVRSNHNRAEEVIIRAEEELALAKLIRCGAKGILCRSTIEDLS